MSASSLRATALFSIAAALGVYALMLLGYRQDWGWLAGADGFGLRAGYDIGIKHPGWVSFWDGVSTVFAPVVFRAAGMLAAVVALLRRRFWPALFLLVALEPSGWIVQTVKDMVDRPRPVTALAHASSSSFPSGHAMGAMVGVGALLMVALPLLRGRVRLVTVCVGALVVAAVGAARVALNVHHPSDVLAGWSLGWAYVCGWAVLLQPWIDRVDPVGPTPQDDLDDQ